jgi:hydrogenase expression/formation protein HypC
VLGDVNFHPDTCVTCGDVAVVARVVQVAGDTATVDVAGACEEVGVELVAPVIVGEFVLCHAGIALTKVESAA